VNCHRELPRGLIASKIMLAALCRRNFAASISRAVAHKRNLCDGVQVDMVCRVYSCKVKDDPTAHKMDLAFEDFLDAVADAEGCVGAIRLVCKSEWDYKLILKFENSAGLKGFMNDKHGTVTEQWMPNIKALAVDGKVHEQNFVYDDIE
jgi:hypothetical protein